MKSSHATALALLGLALTLTGCNKDADFEAFVTANDALAKAVKEAAAESPEKARAVFDEGKAGVRAKLEKLKGTRGFQVREKPAKAYETSVVSSLDEICHLDIEALCTDYKSMLAE